MSTTMKLAKDATVVLTALFAALLLSSGMAFAAHTTPGNAGMTKVNVYDDTNDGWDLTDPVIGFVNFRPTVNGDPDNVKVVVALQNAAPNCTFNIELVTSGNDDEAGLAPGTGHTGWINVVGEITTNKHGKANSGDITVDVNGLSFVAPSGELTYAHVDLEPQTNDCYEDEAAGDVVVNNEYGASGKVPGTNYDLPVNMHWLQP